MDQSMLNALLVVLIAFVALRMIPRLLAGVPFVDPTKVHETLNADPNSVLIDVRTPEEFRQGHAKDSINVQPQSLSDDLDAKKQYLDHKIFVICLSSQRAAMAAKTLKNLGFSNVCVVKGGFNLWKKRKLPTG